jgi:hypothetical protein
VDHLTRDLRALLKAAESGNYQHIRDRWDTFLDLVANAEKNPGRTDQFIAASSLSDDLKAHLAELMAFGLKSPYRFKTEQIKGLGLIRSCLQAGRRHAPTDAPAVSVIEVAKAYKMTHPNASYREVAKAAVCSHSKLLRSPEYVQWHEWVEKSDVGGPLRSSSHRGTDMDRYDQDD